MAQISGICNSNYLTPNMYKSLTKAKFPVLTVFSVNISQMVNEKKYLDNCDKDSERWWRETSVNTSFA